MNLRAAFPKLLCLALFVGLVLPGRAPAADYSPDYVRVRGDSWVQDKNFYLLTLVQKLPAVRAALAAEPALQSPGLVFDCYILDAQMVADHMTLSDDTIAAVRATLIRLEPTNPALQSLVTDHLRPSGAYIQHATEPDAQLLADAWLQDAKGLNNVIRRYATGKADTNMDSPSYDPAAPAYLSMIRTAAHDSVRAKQLIFEPALTFALQLLALNHRDEPARHEPLAQGENRAATEIARSVDWTKFKYAALLVHGIGLDDPGLAISDGSRENCAAAAKLYHDGLAPFIIVSGGYCHPKQTIYAEAIEMKKELMLVHHIPEFAILIDPQARHTTTNVRNGVRLLLAVKAPLDKPSLSVAQKAHVDYIASDKFKQYCLETYGVRCGPRTSDTTAEFLPSVLCMQIGEDPLDP